VRIGRHIPMGSQPLKALRTAKEIGCDALQIFVTNPRGWRVPASRPKAEDAYRAAVAELDLAPVVIHATYLINLASPRDDFFAQSVTLLRATLERAARYGAASVVLHIGSHMGSGVEAGLARLAAGVRQTLEGAPEAVTLLLENDVGAGGELGSRFEQIAAVLAAVPQHAEQLGVCLDTAHLWGAGFDIGTAEGATSTLAEVERLIGLRRVRVLHLNDTKVALGSHRDIHARIGEGVIGAEGLRTLLRAPGLAHAAVLLETPFQETTPGQMDWAYEAEQLQRVNALAGRAASPAAPTKRQPRRASRPADVTADGAARMVGDAAPPSAPKKRKPRRASAPAAT
jgi:deoxyribonuclease IV